MGRRVQGSGAFTLVEAMVSIAIAAGMLLMIAAIFRHTSQVTREVRASAHIHQVARQVFELFGRDMAGVTRQGFMILRAQSRRFWSPTQSKLSLYYDGDGQLQHITEARTDMLVLLTSGNQRSATDSDRTSSFARVLWGQTERINGSDNEDASGRGPASDPLSEHPEFLGEYQVLSRNQTLLIPDLENLGDGANRGPDFYNMSISDFNALFWPAMGAFNEDFLYGVGFGMPTGWNSPRTKLGLMLVLQNRDLAPWRPVSKAFRLGRDGPGISGEDAGRQGGGDLTSGQTNSEPRWSIGGTPNPGYNYGEGMAGWRGHERTRIYGPKDYHRIMAFGAAVFQVDWSDGRRENGKLVFYPDTRPTAHYSAINDLPSYTWKYGPGAPCMFAWNNHSPVHVRNAYLRVNRGVKGNPRCYPWASPQSGEANIMRAGWSWPKAIRLRILLMDHSADPPVAYEFTQVFTLLAQ